MLLAVDTSTRYAGVALAHEGRVRSCRSWYSAVNHTAELMPAIADTLKSHGITPGDLDGIAVALGPGGFSALRVGLSAAKGLALASQTPVVGIGTLRIEAFPYLGCGLPVCALLDAGRNEVASAHFDTDGQATRDDLVGPPGELLSIIDNNGLGATLFCGEGLQPWSQLIRETLGERALVVAHHSPATRLASLAELGQQRLATGDTDDLATLQPYYLRMPII